MIDHVPPSLREVWGWKRRTDEVTKSMSRRQIIEFYRDRADDVQRKLGLELPTRSPGTVPDDTKPKR